LSEGDQGGAFLAASADIGGQNPAKLDQTNEKVCIGLGGLGDSNF